MWRSIGFYIADEGKITISLSATGGELVADAVMLVSDWSYETPLGSVTKLDFDYTPSGETDPPKNFKLLGKYGDKYEFDELGLLNRYVDRNQNQSKYEYDDEDDDDYKDELTKITRQGGLETNLDYSSNALTTITDFAGRVTDYAILSGQLASITLPDPDSNTSNDRPVFTLTYNDPDTLLESITDAEGNTTKLNYYEPDFRLKSIENADGGKWKITPYLVDGLAEPSGQAEIRKPASGDIADPNPYGWYEPRATYIDPNAVDDSDAYSWLYQADEYGLTTALAKPATHDDWSQFVHAIAVWKWQRNEYGLVQTALQPPGGGGDTPIETQLKSSFVYDAKFNLKSAEYADGSTEAWEYNSSFSVLTDYTDQLGQKTKYDLDSRGNTTDIHELASAGTTLSRDTNFTFTDAPSSISDLPGGLVLTATAAAGSDDAVTSKTVYYETGSAIGLPQHIYAAYGSDDETKVSNTYDDFRNSVTFTNERGKVTTSKHDELNRLVLTELPVPGTSDHGAPQSKTVYNKMGLPVRTYSPRSMEISKEADRYYIETLYNSMNRVEETILPAAVDATHTQGTEYTSPDTFSTKLYYDPNGNLTSMVDSFERETKLLYDERNQQILKTLPDPNTQYNSYTDTGAAPKIRYQYDQLGNLGGQSDPRDNGYYTTFKLDELHRVVRVTEPEPSTGPQPITETKLDKLGRPVEITAPGTYVPAMTDIVYDRLGRISKESLPENKEGQRNTIATTYDLRDNVLTTTNGLGQTTTNKYNLLDRVTDTISQDPGPDSGALHTKNLYFATGELAATRTYDEDDPNSFTIATVGIDDLGRPTTQTGVDPDGNGPLLGTKTELHYDSEGHVTSETVLGREYGKSDSKRVSNYSFDRRGQNWKSEGPEVTLTSVDSKATYVTRPTSTVSFDAAGRSIRTDVLNYDGSGASSEQTITSTLEYDALDRPYHFTSPPNANSEQAETYNYYDAAGNLRFEVDPRNLVTQHFYDVLSRESEVVVPGYDHYYTTYYANGTIWTETDPMYRFTEYTRDALGQAWKTSLPSASEGERAIFQQFDVLGNVTGATDEQGNLTNFTPDQLNRTTTVTQPPDGQGLRHTTKTKLNAFGDAKQVNDPKNQVTQFKTDRMGRTNLTIFPSPDGSIAWTSLRDDQSAAFNGNAWDSYEGEGVNGGYTNASADASETLTATWELYDLDPAKHYNIYATWAPSNTNADDVVYRLFSGTQLGSDIHIDQRESPQLDEGVFFAESHVWRQIGTVAPLSGDLTIELDASDSIGTVVVDAIYVEEVIPGQETETVIYDALGQVSRSFNAEQEVTAFTYDTLGRTLTATSPTGKTTRFVYDLLGQQTAVIDPEENVTEFKYDQLGQEIEEKITLGSTEYTRENKYDVAGNRTLAVDRNGRARKFTFNEVSHNWVEEWFASAADAENPAVGAEEYFVYYYDGVGRTYYVDSTLGSQSYFIDAQDRVTHEHLGNVSVELERDFTGRKDALPNKLTVEINNAIDTETTFGYDGRLRTTSIVQTNGGVSNALEKHVAFTYDAEGRFDHIYRYADAAATQLVVDTSHQYDGEGHLTYLGHSRDADLLAAYSYAFDSAGRIDLLTSFDGTTDYDYLDDGQLSAVDYDFAETAAIPPDDEVVNSYDDNGNNDTGTRSIGDHNRPDADDNYTYLYDEEGNRIRRTSTVTATLGYYDVYTWDNRNRLTGVDHYDDQDVLLSSVAYAYDYLDRLIGRTADDDGAGSNSAVTEKYVYDGNQIVLRLSASNEVLNRYLWGPAVDQLMADEDAVNEVTLWALGDHQNTVRDLVQFDEHDAQDPGDDETVVMNHMTYTAFGAPTYSTETSPTTLFGFTGRYFDAIASLQYNSARWYDPWLQQWLSVDPILFEAGDPNPRRYVGNDPVNNVDPSGLEVTQIETARGWRFVVTADNPIDTDGGVIPKGTVLQSVAVEWFTLAGWMHRHADRADQALELARAIAEQTNKEQRIRFDSEITYSDQSGITEVLNLRSAKLAHRQKYFGWQNGEAFANALASDGLPDAMMGAAENIPTMVDDSTWAEKLWLVGGTSQRARVIATGVGVLDVVDPHLAHSIKSSHLDRIGDPRFNNARYQDGLTILPSGIKGEEIHRIAVAGVETVAAAPEALSYLRMLQIHYGVSTGPSSSTASSGATGQARQPWPECFVGETLVWVEEPVTTEQTANHWNVPFLAVGIALVIGSWGVATVAARQRKKRFDGQVSVDDFFADIAHDDCEESANEFLQQILGRERFLRTARDR